MHNQHLFSTTTIFMYKQ